MSTGQLSDILSRNNFTRRHVSGMTLDLPHLTPSRTPVVSALLAANANLDLYCYFFTHWSSKHNVNQKIKDTEAPYRIHSAFNAANLFEGSIKSRTSPL
jgi:hypothetical protein